MLQVPSRIVRSTLYIAVLAANTGLVATYAPGAVAATQALEEVVVTARKREESVQEVPIAVSAFSSDQLRDAGVSSLKDMANQVPGVSIDSGSIGQIWIRGIGQRDTSSRIDGPTGIYLDGVYVARKEGQLLDVFDTESLQVLRGPQGTLFGKNTTAGAIVISTRKPTNEFGGEISTRIGDYGRRDGKVMVNAPLIDNKLLSKLTLTSVKRDGFQTNVVDNSKMASEDRQAANLQLRWLASDTVTVDSFFYTSKVRETSPGEKGQLLTKSGYAGQDSLYANSMWAGDRRPVWALEAVLPNPAPGFIADISDVYKAAYDYTSKLGDHKVASNGPNHFNVDNYLAGISVDWDINDSLSFKSITGYGYQIVGAMSLNADNDGTGLPFQLNGADKSSPRKQISQEFQLTGEALDQKLNYTTGLFVMQENITDYNASTNMLNSIFLGSEILVLPPNAYHDEFKQKNTTMAAFFQSSYDITDNLQGTVGVRWTSEKRDIKLNRMTMNPTAFTIRLLTSGIPGVQSSTNPALGGAAVVNPANLGSDPLTAIQNLYTRDKNGFYNYPMTAVAEKQDENTWIKLSPMASIKYTLPDEWLNGSFIDSAMTYLTYSEGFKSGTFEVVGGSLSKLDPETVKNFEVGLKVDALEHTLRMNVAAYKMQYDDMQLIQVIPDPVTGNTTVAYTNASKSEITGVEAEFAWQPLAGLLFNLGGSYNDYDFIDYKAQELSTGHLFGGLGTAPTVNRSAEPFPEVPTSTVMAAVQYSFDTSFGVIVPRIQYNWVSERYMGLDAGAGLVKDQSTLDAYHTVDVRLTYRTPDERTQVSLYCSNCTDEVYYDGAASVGDSVGIFPVIDAPPRMYGIEASYKFGAL
jgi:outer membrane receptor protein involved in Fe transport